jgi:hypothetical protein
VGAGLRRPGRHDHERYRAPTAWRADDQRQCQGSRTHPLLDTETVEAATLALTGGERDLESQAAALVELSGMEPREIQRLALAADVSRAVRLALAKKGHALRDGSLPARASTARPASFLAT